MKKKWTYSYGKGLRDAGVSEMIKLERDIFFFLEYGSSNWKSLLLKVNMDTQESQELFSENHIIISLGAFSEDRFYFPTFRGEAYCVDVSGQVIWKTDIGKGNADFSALLDENRVYMSNHGIYCLDKDNGNIIWMNPLEKNKTGCSFAVDESYLYHADLDGPVRCLDKYTGEVVWSYGQNLYVNWCILLDENCLMACGSKAVLFLEAKTGKLIREVGVNGYISCSPVIHNGKVYIGDGNHVMDSTEGKMTCYELQEIHGNYELEKIFSVSTGGKITAKAVIDGERLYFASEDSYFYCVNAETGEEICKRRKTKGECSDILIDGEDIYILSDKGQLECFEH